MTTEVIIKNKSGLVLAADSAVTVTGIGLYGQSSKVYNSANKLFTLSKTEPVGVLVYNAASINEVPVEIVLKEFRDKKRKYNKLKQYQEELLNFIESFINKNTKRTGLINFFDGFLYSYEGFIEQEKNEKQQDFDVDALIKRHEKGLADVCKSYGCPEEFNGISVKEIESEISINKEFQQKFDDFKTRLQYPNDINSITMLFYWYVKFNICQSYTGIAICGYGKDDFFPKVYLCNVYGVINGKILTDDFKAYEEERAEIIPLAQKQMIDTFIKGVSDKLYNTLKSFYFQNFDSFIDAIIPSLKESIDSKEIRDKLRQSFASNAERFKQIVYETEEAPLIQTVNHLSREEMAELAESLINIQVLKYKVSPELETVGGPIDVAIISKHDGFVWRKRKLYFPKELNFQFFENYFK